MKKRSALFEVLLIGACFACGWLLWSQYSELMLLRASLMSVHEHARLAEAVRNARAQMAAANESSAAAGKKQPTKEADVKAPSGGVPDGLRNYINLLSDPEFRRLDAFRWKAVMDARYAGVFKMLKLSPEDLEKYQQLIVDRMLAQRDAHFLALEQGMWPGSQPEQFNALQKAVTDPIDASIKTLLGDDGEAKVNQYLQTSTSRMIATQLQQSLSYSPVPLSDDQVEKLTQLIASNVAPVDTTNNAVYAQLDGGQITMTGGAAVVVTQTNGIVAANAVPFVSDAALNAAAGVLSQQQLEALKQLQQYQQSGAQLGKLLTPPK